VEMRLHPIVLRRHRAGPLHLPARERRFDIIETIRLVMGSHL